MTVHAYRSDGSSWCGQGGTKPPACRVYAAFYRDLCPRCRSEVAALCRRLAP